MLEHAVELLPACGDVFVHSERAGRIATSLEDRSSGRAVRQAIASGGGDDSFAESLGEGDVACRTGDASRVREVLGAKVEPVAGRVVVLDDPGAGGHEIAPSLVHERGRDECGAQNLGILDLPGVS